MSIMRNSEEMTWTDLKICNDLFSFLTPLVHETWCLQHNYNKSLVFLWSPQQINTIIPSLDLVIWLITAALSMRVSSVAVRPNNYIAIRHHLIHPSREVLLLFGIGRSVCQKSYWPLLSTGGEYCLQDLCILTPFSAPTVLCRIMFL